MPDSCFGGVVGSLRLWDVDNGTAHGADHDNAAVGLALHQVLCDTNSEQPRAVDVNTPQLLHTVVWVVNSWVVLGEPGGGDEVVDLAVLRDDLVEGRSHGLGLGDIGVVSGDTRNVFRARILALELCDKSCGLLLTLVLWKILSAKLLQFESKALQQLTVHVDNSDIGTRHNHGLGHDKTQTSGTTSHDTDLVLQREAGKCAQVAAAALDRLG